LRNSRLLTTATVRFYLYCNDKELASTTASYKERT